MLPRFGYSFPGARITIVSAKARLPTGSVQLRAEFTPTGNHQGDVALVYVGAPVGPGHLDRTVPVTFGVAPFSVGSQRSSPILPGLVGRAAITPDVVREIVIETEGRAYRDPAAEQRAALATQ